jgi:hypothetical protein
MMDKRLSKKRERAIRTSLLCQNDNSWCDAAIDLLAEIDALRIERDAAVKALRAINGLPSTRPTINATKMKAIARAAISEIEKLGDAK